MQTLKNRQDKVEHSEILNEIEQDQIIITLKSQDKNLTYILLFLLFVMTFGAVGYYFSHHYILSILLLIFSWIGLVLPQLHSRWTFAAAILVFLYEQNVVLLAISLLNAHTMSQQLSIERDLKQLERSRFKFKAV